MPKQHGPKRLLFVSNLFPNGAEPTRGTFNVRPVELLQQYCEVQVVAPISWFPIPGKFAPPAEVPVIEQIEGLTVHHPRARYLPKLLRPLNPWLFAASLRRPLAAIRRQFAFDHIHVDWLYPDACGGRLLAQFFELPLTVSAAGSDAVWYMNWQIRRAQILRTLKAARACYTRSRHLRELLIGHGANANSIRVIYNGVDAELFRPAYAERQLTTQQQQGRLAYVGRLSPEKGVDDLLRSLALLNKSRTLTVVGDGPQRGQLQALADSLALQGRINWLGRRLPSELPGVLASVDVLCLASHREGVPNVLLEANAAGLPVVANAVGGVPEVVTADTGLLVRPHDPAAFAESLETALSRNWDRTKIRQHALRFSWADTAKQMYELFGGAHTTDAAQPA